MRIFCANSVTDNYLSNIGYPHTTSVCLEKPDQEPQGDSDWDEFHNRPTQDLTRNCLNGVIARGESGQRNSPSGIQGQRPGSCVQHQ